LASVEQLEGHLTAARTLFERSLALSRHLGHQDYLAGSLQGLGVVAELEGDYERAGSFFEQSVPIYRQLDARGSLAWGLHALGFAAYQRGDFAAAQRLLAESLSIFRGTGHRYGLARSLERFAGFALAQQQCERAARLYGAAAGLREAIGAPLGPLGQAEADRDLAAIRASLSGTEFARAWAEGGAMTLEQALDYALGP
jgi:tetratricopeptide (TPR) repeat protein